jgi:sterol desaturase/sphingolipid hydroxylase (fatty acid hydroxylase superfamily)
MQTVQLVIFIFEVLLLILIKPTFLHAILRIYCSISPFICFVLARYHSIYHKTTDSNFCLFMPLFDALRGTMKDKSSELQKKNSAGPSPAFNITLYEKYINYFIVRDSLEYYLDPFIF